MYVRCEKRGMRIEGEWVSKGGVKQVSDETAKILERAVAAKLVTLHTKDPAAKRASARKAKAAPGMETLEKSVKESPVKESSKKEEKSE